MYSYDGSLGDRYTPVCHSSTVEMKTEGLVSKASLSYVVNIQASLGYLRPYLKRKTKPKEGRKIKVELAILFWHYCWKLRITFIAKHLTNCKISKTMTDE